MTLNRLIKKLERGVDADVIVVAASWRDDIATDLDARAARFAAELVDDVKHRALLVYMARGGDTAFADHLSRSLAARDISYDLAVPTLVNAAGTLLALRAERILLHPHGGIGAYDAGPLRVRDAMLSARTFDDVPALGGIQYAHDTSLPLRLAGGMRERRLSRAFAQRFAGGRAVDRLTQLELGDEVGFGAEELAAAGFEAQTWDHAPLWALFGELERQLGVLSVPKPAYTEADLADEVEFEPAVGLTGALVASRARIARYVLDTGSPHPDTGVFAGAWSWQP